VEESLSEKTPVLGKRKVCWKEKLSVSLHKILLLKQVSAPEEGTYYREYLECTDYNKKGYLFQPRGVTEESSDDEVGSESPLDEVAVAPEFGGSSAGGNGVYPPSSLSLREHRIRHDSGTRSDTSYVSYYYQFIWQSN
jgi:hypothetical protein